MKDSIIEVKDFRKTCGDFIAVDGVSFEVRQGEIFGLPGPNGAGKTSALEHLEGLRAPNSVQLQSAGIDPVGESRRLRNLIGATRRSFSLHIMTRLATTPPMKFVSLPVNVLICRAGNTAARMMRPAWRRCWKWLGCGRQMITVPPEASFLPYGGRTSVHRSAVRPFNPDDPASTRRGRRGRRFLFAGAKSGRACHFIARNHQGGGRRGGHTPGHCQNTSRRRL